MAEENQKHYILKYLKALVITCKREIGNILCPNIPKQMRELMANLLSKIIDDIENDKHLPKNEEDFLMHKIDNIFDKIAEKNEFRRIPPGDYERMTIKITQINPLDLKACRPVLDEIYSILKTYFPDYADENNECCSADHDKMN